MPFTWIPGGFCLRREAALTCEQAVTFWDSVLLTAGGHFSSLNRIPKRAEVWAYSVSSFIPTCLVYLNPIPSQWSFLREASLIFLVLPLWIHSHNAHASPFQHIFPWQLSLHSWGDLSLLWAAGLWEGRITSVCSAGTSLNKGRGRRRWWGTVCFQGPKGHLDIAHGHQQGARQSLRSPPHPTPSKPL